MSEFDAEISSIYQEMDRFLKSQARNEIVSNEPLYLRTQYKSTLKLSDSEKNVFSVQESYLNAFREIYTDKVYKVVRLHNWEFEIQFIGKKCNKIQLLCDSVAFISSKTNKKEINGCHFKIVIAENQTEVKRLSPEVLGYLNRLGKRNLCTQSFNVAKQMKSLLSFATSKPNKIQTFAYRPWNQHDHEVIDPLSALNKEGRKVLEKLRDFISRQQIRDFIVEQQVSEEAASQLRKLVAEQRH